MTIVPDFGLRASCELCRGVACESHAEIHAGSFRRRLATNDVLVRQGDTAEAIYIVVAGQLRATQTTADGQQVIVRYLGPGELVGPLALAGEAAHSDTVTAVNDTHLIGWSSAEMRAIIGRHPAIAFNALAALGRRYRESQTRVQELSTEKVDRRLAHTVLRLAAQSGRRTARGIEIPFPLSRQDLAELAGTTLHTVSRTLSAWETSGIVDSGRRRVIVTDEPRLLAIAGGD